MKSKLIYSLLIVSATASMAAAQQDFRTSRMPRTSSSGSGGSVSTEKPTDATPKPRKMEEPFTILQNTSIFARDRRTGTVAPDNNIVSPPPNPETYYAFRGAAEENGKLVAFLEDTRDGSTMRYSVGEQVASGTIKEITLDTLKYARRDGLLTATINLGCDLAGREAAVAVASNDSGSSSSSNSRDFSPQGIDAINNYGRGRGRGGFGNNGFGTNGFGSNGFDNSGGFRQRGFPGNFNGSQGGFGADGGGAGFRQRGMGGSGYNQQQDYSGGGGRRNRRQNDGGGYGG
jgi:hypothetical protein